MCQPRATSLSPQDSKYIGKQTAESLCSCNYSSVNQFQMYSVRLSRVPLV